jgi:succinoglycan biosynthesis protein ExoA
MDIHPFITIVIPVRNEEQFIAGTMGQIIDQDYSPDRFEILVIDGCSTDNTVRIVESFKDRFRNIKILSNPKCRSSSSRNIGFREGRGEYMIVIDGHVYIENKHLLHDMIDTFKATGFEVLSRPQPLTPPDNNEFQKTVAMARESVIGHGLDSTIYNMKYEGEVDPSSSGAMYKKTIFDSIGFVDEGFDAAEDYEFNYRASLNGFKSYISPKLAIYYYPRDSFKGLFKQLSRYGLGRFRFISKHRDQMISANLIPPLFFTTLFVLGILSIFLYPFRKVLFLLAAIYVVIIIGDSIYLAQKRGFKHLLKLILIYFTIHFGLAAGFISGFFKKHK